MSSQPPREAVSASEKNQSGAGEAVDGTLAAQAAAVSPLRAFGAPRKPYPFEAKIDTRRRRNFKEIARALPRAPGVYFFYGLNERLLYIGKAKCLRERVRSYFAETSLRRPPKLRRLLAEIQRLEFQVCGSELEALLVERELIATRRPILNHQHNRFEVYPYLLLSDEAFPRLTLTRAEPHSDVEENETRDDESDFFTPPEASAFVTDSLASLPENLPRAGDLPGLYLGPFTSPRAARWTLEAVRNLFPLRSCDDELKPDANGRSCFYHDIGRCSAPCVDAISRSKYLQICDDLLKLLRTGQAPQLDAMQARMEKLAEDWRFEDAAKLREQLQAVEIVAARLRRLQRMREEHNLAIVQPALPAESTCRENSTPAACVFLVQGGAVRRKILVADERQWERLKTQIQQLFSSPPPPPVFTAKTELDEMMILDRWLQAHGKEPCCAWLNERPSRQWASNTVRKLRRWATHESNVV